MRLVMSQAAPTFCIHVPTFDPSAASQIQRKIGVRSGWSERGRVRLIDPLSPMYRTPATLRECRPVPQ